VIEDPNILQKPWNQIAEIKTAPKFEGEARTTFSPQMTKALNAIRRTRTDGTRRSILCEHLYEYNAGTDEHEWRFEKEEPTEAELSQSINIVIVHLALCQTTQPDERKRVRALATFQRSAAFAKSFNVASRGRSELPGLLTPLCTPLSFAWLSAVPLNLRRETKAGSCPVIEHTLIYDNIGGIRTKNI
jgi:hypothetical protein